MRIIRIILCYLFISLSIKAHSQIKIDKNLPAKFLETSKALNPIYQSAFLEMNKKNEYESLGIGIITSYKIDTLNLNDLVKDLKNEVTIVDLETGLEQEITDQNM